MSPVDLATRQPGTLWLVIPCTCPAGYTHPDRRTCPRHQHDPLVAAAAKTLRRDGAHAALAVLKARDVA